MTVNAPTAICLYRIDRQANKRMHQTKSVMAPRTTAFAGDPQRWTDLGGASVSRAFEKQYDEEAYLFDVVGPAFRATGQLDAYDFFFIVRWKANRAISRVAHRLLAVGGPGVEAAVSKLARELFVAQTPRERFDVLLARWSLRLPMASAILTVLYPKDFTVYDARACDELGGFQGLAECRDLEAVWSGYQEFKAAVEREAPAHLCLRDKDRFLWARSRHKSLVGQIAKDFGVV